jgi:hypothetical protein
MWADGDRGGEVDGRTPDGADFVRLSGGVQLGEVASGGRRKEAMSMPLLGCTAQREGLRGMDVTVTVFGWGCRCFYGKSRVGVSGDVGGAPAGRFWRRG